VVPQTQVYYPSVACNNVVAVVQRGMVQEKNDHSTDEMKRTQYLVAQIHNHMKPRTGEQMVMKNLRFQFPYLQ
jgi:hypothetical protein